MELFVALCFVAGMVAVVVRFGPSPDELRLPDVVDRSIGMDVLRRIRSSLVRETPEDRSSDALATAIATTPVPDTALVDVAPPGDFAATPARLTAVGVRRAVPVRLAGGRRPFQLAARSVPPARLRAVDPPPLWRRALTRARTAQPAQPVESPRPAAAPASRPAGASTGGRRRAVEPGPRRSSQAPRTRLAALATAVTIGLIWLVAVVAAVQAPPGAGGVLAATGRPTASGGRPSAGPSGGAVPPTQRSTPSASSGRSAAGELP